MFINSNIYTELIHIGQTGSITCCVEILKCFPKGTCDAWKLYDSDLCNKFQSNDLINLFKGFVICEKELQWSCGSTTPAAHLYNDIKAQNLDPDNSIAAWAFQYSDNEYIPFGFKRHGERSAEEYLQWMVDYLEREHQEQNAKIERKKRQLDRANKIVEEKRKKDRANREYYQQVMCLPPNEQVDRIVSDDKHVFYFYMPVIYNLLNREDVRIEDLLKLESKMFDLGSTPVNIKIWSLISEKIRDIAQKTIVKRENSVETIAKLSMVEKEVNQKVDEILKNEPRLLGSCHSYWSTKKRILKEEYGIDWLTPAECNPEIRYD